MVGYCPMFWACLGGFTLRYAQTIKDLGFDMQFNAETPRPLAQPRYPLVG